MEYFEKKCPANARRRKVVEPVEKNNESEKEKEHEPAPNILTHEHLPRARLTPYHQTMGAGARPKSSPTTTTIDETPCPS